MNRFLVFGLTSLAAGSLAFAACGGDDSTSSSATSQPGGATSSSGNGSATKPADSATKAPGEGQVTGSGANALKQLAGDLSKKTYQVSYQMQITTAGTTTPNKGAMTLAQKPPKSLTSYDSTDASGKTTNVMLINDGTSSFSCFKDPKSGAGQCIKSSASGAANPLGAGFSLDAALKNLTDNINVTDAGSKNVGGIDSRCFTIKESTGDGTACFSKQDGLVTLLDSKNTDGSSVHIEATKASGSVQDRLFAPPSDYKVIENPGR